MHSLEAQLQELQSQIKRDASSAKLRVHLFQLLCVMGKWQRALQQLQLCAQLDIKAMPMAQMYREAIRCELYREDVFAGKRSPQTMGKPPGWVSSLVEALRHDAAGEASAAADLRGQAMEAAEPCPCTVDGAACEWLADGDSRLGPVCEVIANGQYYWLPYESCAEILVDPPADMRDLVWMPAQLVLPNEGRVPALIPTRYPGTAASTEDNADALRLSRATAWLGADSGHWTGVGQRVLVSDAAEHPLLDIRAIVMAADSGPSAEEAVR
ncbi:MAG: type VI secretion system accessory protein TagJ [Pseudoxanthomonas sp.]